MAGALKILLGLGVAAFAQVIAMGMAGAGHGWISPFWSSIGLWVCLPLGFYFAAPFKGYAPERRNLLIALLVIGAASDLILVGLTINEGTEYFWKIWYSASPIALLWMALFLSWQILIGLTLFAGPRDELTV